jgi:hypothetical protein
MKAIDIKFSEMGSVTSRVDGGVAFRVITPELTLDQRATLLGLHGKNVRCMLEPIDVPVSGLDEVTTELDAKTPCQRLRAVLFVHWKDRPIPMKDDDFETFYRHQMDKIIEGYKTKNLPPRD